MALTNPSNNEKTIKNYLLFSDSDNYVVDKILLYCNYNNENIIQFGNILDNYRDYFDKYLIDYDVPERFYYQPAAVAEAYYGTPDLDFLVLYFSKITSLLDFNKPQIKILDKTKMPEINRLFVSLQDSVKESYNNPTKYLKDVF